MRQTLIELEVSKPLRQPGQFWINATMEQVMSRRHIYSKFGKARDLVFTLKANDAEVDEEGELIHFAIN